MSAAHDRHDAREATTADLPEGFHDGPSLSLAADLVEVRRNAGVAAGVGGVSSAVAIAYLARAAGTGSLLDWSLVLVTGLIGVLWLASFVDARTPLLVADAQGVRVRLGRTWRGLPWSAVDRVEHTPRRGLLRDGRLNVVPRNTERLLAELDRRGARQASLATRMYGGPLALPLGLTTRVSAGDDDVAVALARLADRGAEVVVLGDEPAPGIALPESADGPAEVDESRPEESGAASEARVVRPEEDEAVAPRMRDPRPLLASALARVSAVLPGRDKVDEDLVPDVDENAVEEAPFEAASADAEVDHEIDADDALVASETPAPSREAVPPARAEVRRMSTGPADGTEDTEVLPRAVELVEDDETWADRVRPIARAGHPVEPLAIDDFVVEPAEDPVVGPELRAARTRLGLSVDQLAERTRIRPHVIEAVEVDDFVPCGGDFYARGHLRTLARVLGVDVTPLLAAYDERYAHAPIDPRRVFEAELATGAHGPIRGTRGGANWSVLVAAVMAVVLVWSVARLVMDAPADLGGTPVLNGSGGPHGGSAVAADPVPVVLTAPAGGAKVVVRDSTGKVVLKGNLAIGESRTVEASPPVRVQSSDGSVTVQVGGADRGPVGEAGQAAQGTYAAD